MPAIIMFLLLIPFPVLSCSDTLPFADSLYAEGDFYRAITEYKRFLFNHPDDPQAPRAQLSVAESLLAGERWLEADLAFERVWQRYPASEAAATARRRHADAAARRGDHTEAQRRYRNLIAEDPEQASAAKRQIGWSLLEENRVSEARRSFASLPEPQRSELNLALDDYEQLPRKSPQLAGTLSALLPGAGQLYSGHPRQAAGAFALNAAFIYGAVEAWNNENYVVAALVGLFELGWYGGNIVNAMNLAHKHNQRLEEQQREQLRQRFSFGLGWQGETPQLQARLRF